MEMDCFVTIDFQCDLSKVIATTFGVGLGMFFYVCYLL